MAKEHESAVMAAHNLEVLPHITAQIAEAEEALWSNEHLGIIEQGGEKGVIVAPNDGVLLAVVRSRQGLHVERHIGVSAIPCDYFSLTGRGISWGDLGTHKPRVVESRDTPPKILQEIMRRFKEPSPTRGGYLGFIRGDDVALVARRMQGEGHAFRLPLLAQRLGEWGITETATPQLRKPT